MVIQGAIDSSSSSFFFFSLFFLPPFFFPLMLVANTKVPYDQQSLILGKTGARKPKSLYWPALKRGL
jgi:hypothetical protein